MTWRSLTSCPPAWAWTPAAKDALRAKATRKKKKYEELVRLHKFGLIPFLMSTFGAFEEEDAGEGGELFCTTTAGFSRTSLCSSSRSQYYSGTL